MLHFSREMVNVMLSLSTNWEKAVRLRFTRKLFSFEAAFAPV